MDQPLINIERKFRPEIEGLRFVAAMLVAVYHIWFHRVSGGVDVFFVISGFLITTSIISTINKTRAFRFWPYVSKLMKRLFPSVFFILGIVLVCSFFFLPASIFHKTIREVIASMFYYQNWQLAISSTDYLDVSQMKSPVEHFWALSIQGQFYIIWFLIFTVILLMIRKFKYNPRKLINIVLGLLFIISLCYSIYLTHVNQPLAYFITFTRVWEFALGGLICVNLSSIKLNKFIAAFIGWLGLVGLIVTGMIFEVSQMFPGYIALWPMACALLIILSGEQETKYSVKRFLGNPLMVKLGGISFGIYLWHWVLLMFYRYNIAEDPGIIIGMLIILISIILSFLMTKFIEEPVRRAKVNRFAFRRLAIMGIVNILIIVALIVNVQLEPKAKITSADYPGAMAASGVVDVPYREPIPSYSEVFDDLPISHLDGSNQTLEETSVRVGEYGELEMYDATIALVGSSHAEHWLGAILEATENHNFRVLSLTRSGTRFSTGYNEGTPKATWNKNVLDYLEDADIDLVIGQGTASDTTKPEIQQQMIDQLEYVKEEYGMDVLVVRDNPRFGFNVLESLEMNGVAKTKKKMNEEKKSQQDEAYWINFEQENKSLYTFDLSDYFKVDGEYEPIIGNIIIYRDGDHITNTYAESFGPIFEKKIMEILEKRGRLASY
ncbi:Peptidoglycan/LPS O-acetylase OafA/YrhL, contains acyltransferase and SGNH-hydrolase domains [Oceanobacillus limi]|uniref:Peptidoglycan/LPS O-acetylase OafA/YrhL, contains acyltransferase and SGNH-hydrolase domains n=1 Tax=Oceanobacillus limi TaxID=930131 RepID=A0A1I0A1X7_9BACI|nr:acyltransferase family protein [Oceanobacillus limi]SES88119.1 Peptidoglycan/LPS O-acetylase OafA/YrhL, contains acyltransferase and SGNH-hydrolase domains [Oceanobacillus limi]